MPADTTPTPPAPQTPAQRATGPILRVEVAALPPSVNHLYITRKDGGKVISPVARSWYDVAGWAARGAAQGADWECPAGDLSVSIALTLPTRGRMDLDNRLKAALDAVSRALGFDDSRITDLRITRAGYGPARTVVLVGAAHGPGEE